MKTLTGRLTIAFTASNTDDEFVSVRVEDDSSGVRAVELRIPLVTWAKALASRGYLPIEYVVFNADLLGFKREHKTELVKVPRGLLPHPPEVAAAQHAPYIRPFEVDGWRVHERDIGNYHRRKGSDTGGEVWEFGFTRYVSPEGVPYEDLPRLSDPMPSA